MNEGESVEIIYLDIQIQFCSLSSEKAKALAT